MDTYVLETRLCFLTYYFIRSCTLFTFCVTLFNCVLLIARRILLNYLLLLSRYIMGLVSRKLNFIRDKGREKDSERSADRWMRKIYFFRDNSPIFRYSQQDIIKHKYRILKLNRILYRTNQNYTYIIVKILLYLALPKYRS